MGAVVRSFVVLAAGLVTVAGPRAFAASDDIGVGGYHERALRAAQSGMGGAPVEQGDDGPLTIGLAAGPSSALTAFTPRVGGLALGLQGDQPAAATPPGAPGPGRLQVGLGDRAEFAGWQVDLAAIAGVTRPRTGLGAGESGMVVGGKLAVSGLRLDATYGEDASLIGREGSRVTAGVAYGLGPLDARMSYSLIGRDDQVETSLLTVGSQLTLRPGFVVQGDIAYADDEVGDPTTAGLVSLRLNF